MAAQVNPRHDFVAKLRQESVLPHVLSYVRWRQAVERAREAKESLPELPETVPLISINLDLTTACNYHCPHCIDLEALNGRERYKHDELLCSLEHMVKRGLKSAILIGGGEPTVYPKFRESVRFLKEHGVQLGIVSNGSRNHLIEEVAECLEERDWIRLSLDSGTNDTFVRMHKPLKGVSLEGICEWVPKFHEKYPKIVVGFSYIVTWKGATNLGQEQIIENIGEMVETARLAKEYTFNYISFKAFLKRAKDGAEIMDPAEVAHQETTLRRIAVNIEEAKQYDEPPRFRVSLSQNLPALLDGSWRKLTEQPHVCHVMALRLVQSPLGLYNCPAHRGQMKARVTGPNGFLDEASVLDTRKKLSNMIETFDAKHECRNVTCFYNSTNRWMEKLVTGEIDIESIEAIPDWGDYCL